MSGDSNVPGEAALPEAHYDASGRDRIAIEAWAHMVRELVACRELIHRLLVRNFSAQFRQSFLGYVWIALPPVATTVVFTMLWQAKIVNVPIPENGMPYALFVLVGTTVWGFFTQLVLNATGSIASAGALVSRIYFPREVLLFSTTGGAVINLGIRTVVVALTFLIWQYAPHWQVVFVPLLLVPLLLLAVGLGMLFAPINTMMNDVGRFLEFMFQFGMFLAPTVYPTPSLDTATGWQAALFWVHKLNPVSHFLYAIQDLIQHGSMAWTPGLSASCILSVLVFALGWRFFHICEPLLAERL